MLNYYKTKLERINRKIERIKDKYKLGDELPFNEQAALLVAEAEQRLLEEFIDDLEILQDKKN